MEARLAGPSSSSAGGVLEGLLSDIRDLVGAESSAVWRVVPDAGGGAPELVAWSALDRKAPVLDAKSSGMVKWAAQQAPGELCSDSDVPHFVATPLYSESVPDGVLAVLGGSHGLRMSRDELRNWMPRFAERVAGVSALLEVRQVAERGDRQTAILLAAATRLQEHRTVDLLGQHLCSAATEMTGAKRAALIRWDTASESGVVAYATRGHLVAVDDVVESVSQTGAACAGAFPVILDDASSRGQLLRVYGGREVERTLGALAIVPLRATEGVIGALVVEGDSPGQVSGADRRNLHLLGLLAAASLETVWEIQEINRRARTDALTGLANRQEFEDRLQRLVAETDRYGGSAALVVLDIDHFKHVNDTYGHPAGDQVLKHVAGQLRRTMRTVDVCARYGGEEIAILLPQTGVRGAYQFAERVRQYIGDNPVVVGGRAIPVTVSVGVASYPEAARGKDELIAAADRALYSAKRAGRNRVMADTV